MKEVPTVQTDDAATIATAIEWHLRQATMDAAAWEDFVAWLEADPAHARAYDRVAADDRALGDVTFPAPPAVVSVATVPSRRRWVRMTAGAAIAAGIVAVALPFAVPSTSGRYAVESRPGERRSVQLADGTRIDLSGGTRLMLDRHDPRFASLSEGEAMFHVVHDAATPFTLHAGDVAIRDLGTAFDVVREQGGVDIQVASGSVMVRPEADAVVLRAGDTLHVAEGGAALVPGRVAPDAVGGWRDGRLVFTGQPLGTAFAAIERRYGTRVTLPPSLSARPFTGMVTLSGAADRDIPHLATLVGARAQRDGQNWSLTLAP